MPVFHPALLREEPTPRNVKGCNNCGLDKHGTRMIWGEGNPNAPIMIVLDNPGARENRDGDPFVCGTRQTLQHAVHDVGLDINDLYITFVLKRKPVRAYDKEDTRRICIGHLHDQLHDKQPKFIICLGNVAVQSFFENNEVDVKSLRGKIHQVKGFHTAVAYHPLAVRRRPNLWPLFIDDFTFVAKHYQNINDV